MTNTPADWNPRFDLQNRNQVDVHDEMRRQCPVAYSEAFGWSVFRHTDVTQILGDHDSFSSAVSQHLSVPNGMDPPEHTAYRKMIDRYFAPDRIEALEPVCRQIADDLIVTAINGGGDVEVMSELAARFAAQSQCAFLGWPKDLHIPLIDWVTRNHQAIRDRDQASLSRLAREFEAIVDEQVDQRIANQAESDHDTTASLMHEQVHGRRLSSEELSSILRNWTVGEIGTISASIAEPLKTFRPELSASERRAEVMAMMDRVGLDPAMYNRYPHELSGGQNQRVGIARAMINKPKLVICDEAVSALDVSIQAQIIELLKDLQREFGMAMIFISHDLSVVRSVANRIMVLYLGRVVELGDGEAVCSDPKHPYTQSLISAVPIPDPAIERSRTRLRIPGELPSPMDSKAALRFLPSKLEAGEYDYVPQLSDVGGGHMVAEHDPLEKILAA